MVENAASRYCSCLNMMQAGSHLISHEGEEVMKVLSPHIFKDLHIIAYIL
jgi:hypothetical protein